MTVEKSEAADHIEALEKEVERLTINGIHTCHDNCQRLPCVQGREIRRLEAEVKTLRGDLSVERLISAAAEKEKKRLEAEVAQLKELLCFKVNLTAEMVELNKEKKAAEARAERLREALIEIARHRDGAGCNPAGFTETARKALEDDKLSNPKAELKIASDAGASDER